ncbi:hypothetical protein BV20DRAFT_964437 [Pilatotrama ljubarskyi]|nr:hypothetical protein BV20DRAFT_964437 [Pilatotrama ljubarskyi]
MSYGQQSRNTESWANDPNNFSNPSGPNAGFQNQRGNWNDNQEWGSQRPTHDPTDTSTWNSDPSSRRGFDNNDYGRQQGEGQQWSASRGENYGSSGYQGNTSDVNTYGAGGNTFGSTGAGRGAGTDSDNWRSRDINSQQQNNNYGDDVNPGAGKTSLGERLKGNAEKLAGRVSGNPSLVEKGQVRKSGNPDDTSWNSNSNDY